jgi:hypothetical protein
LANKPLGRSAQPRRAKVGFSPHLFGFLIFVEKPKREEQRHRRGPSFVPVRPDEDNTALQSLFSLFGTLNQTKHRDDGEGSAVVVRYY